MKFTFVDTIILILVVNITAAIGAFGFGYLQDAIGHVRAMHDHPRRLDHHDRSSPTSPKAKRSSGSPPTSPACAWAPRQAAGRAIVGYLSPPERNAEFFGLWGLAVKAASIFGPLTYGTVTWIFEGNHRLGILAVGAYFVVGLVLLAGIDVERGRRAALQSN